MSKNMHSDTNYIDYLLNDAGDTFYHLTRDNISGLNAYLAVVEKLIANSKNEDFKIFNTDFKKIPNKYKERFFDTNFPYQWDDIYSSNLRTSFIILIISISESYVKIICRDVASIVKSQITVDDLKGGLFSKSKKFLFEFGKFKIPEERSWELINSIYSIRNVIVHNMSIIEGTTHDKRIRALMRRAPGISNPSLGLLEINEEFCKFALKEVSVFIDKLYKSFQSLCKNSYSQ